jgi:hypothetical protein
VRILGGRLARDRLVSAHFARHLHGARDGLDVEHFGGTRVALEHRDGAASRHHHRTDHYTHEQRLVHSGSSC